MVKQVTGESLVLAGEEWTRLWGWDIEKAGLALRSCYGALDEGCVEYAEGADYEADRAAGRIRRLPGSRIPDYRGHVFYGVDNFNHADAERFGNSDFIAWADYRAGSLNNPWDGMAAVRCLPPGFAGNTGQPLRVLVYGDSISTGADAALPERTYFGRLASWLEERRGAPVEVTNVSLGGETSRGGLARYESLGLKPGFGLCVLAYGMNDASCPGGNKPPNFVPVREYADNIRALARKLRGLGAEVLLLSTLVPNPRWRFAASRAADDLPVYGSTLERIAREEGYSYADIYGVWKRFLERKKHEDLLANNVNHPGDFGHWIYAECIERLL